MKKYLLSIVSLIIGLQVVAQDVHRSCATAEKRNQLWAEHPEAKQIHEQLEQFTQEFIAKEQNTLTKGTRGTIYTIPVVVHVIHNGEAVGSGQNISDAQINSQITVLNKDFRKLNTDWSSKTPSVWQSLVADCEIQFCLAKQTPTGASTTGIDRINGGKTSWTDTDIDAFRSTSPRYWDPSKYLNIWVVTFNTSMGGILGYTTPTTGGWPAKYDGIVVNHTFFGTVGTVLAPINKGRTMTHEIGHYFNLDHIWGDDNGACSGQSGFSDDGVSDTPIQAGENYNCPSFPSVSCSGNANGDMFMNYMDYVDDACMVMFTTGQKNRMRATLATGATHVGLTTSMACNPVGITEVKGNQDAIDVYPVPASSYVYVSSMLANFENNFSYKIFNMLGQEVTGLTSSSKEYSYRYAINTSQLSAGNYVLKVFVNNLPISKSISITQ